MSFVTTSEYRPLSMPPVKPPATYCTYYDICPSASDWCKNRQPSAKCLPFLDNAEAKLNSKITTLYSIKRYIEVNDE